MSEENHRIWGAGWGARKDRKLNYGEKFWVESYNNFGFYKAVWLHKLYQNVWHRLSGLCPDLPGSPREGKEERRIDGGREVASRPKPPRFMTDHRHCWQVTIVIQHICATVTAWNCMSNCSIICILYMYNAFFEERKLLCNICELYFLSCFSIVMLSY